MSEMWIIRKVKNGFNIRKHRYLYKDCAFNYTGKKWIYWLYKTQGFTILFGGNRFYKNWETFAHESRFNNKFGEKGIQTNKREKYKNTH